MTITVVLTTSFIIWTAIQGLFIIALIVGAWYIISGLHNRSSGPPIYLAAGPEKTKKRRKRK